jgi:hypothetical protein
MKPSPIYPTRFKQDQQRAYDNLRQIRWLLKPAQQISDAERDQRLLANLMICDPPSDKAYREAGVPSLADLKEQIKLAKTSLAASTRPQSQQQALINQVTRTPDWVDWDQVERGAAVCRATGLTGLRVLCDFSLLSGYQLSAINQTLLFTGNLSSSVRHRLAQTTNWWVNCTRPHAMRPGNLGFNSTLQVRLIHSAVRDKIMQTNWNVSRLGLPINQTDMQVTYLSFSIVFLSGCRVLGCLINSEEAQALMHLWRYIGWVMGVDESLLIDTPSEGLEALYHNLLTQPMADQSSVKLARALLSPPEGLTRSWFESKQGQLQSQIHRSILRFSGGKQLLDDLGLKPALPWFVLVAAPINAAVSLPFKAHPKTKHLEQWLGARTQSTVIDLFKKSDLIGEKAG